MRDIKEILKEGRTDSKVTVSGWVRTKRETKNTVFIELNDGSAISGIQTVFDTTHLDENTQNLIEKTSTGAAITVEGKLVKSPGAGQSLEVQGERLELLGECPPDYPLQKKAHSFEFLREIAHLRPRTNSIGAVARMRDEMSYATHSFFRERGFRYVHTPIITASDCEGAGEMFQVTTLDMEKIAKTGKAPDYSEDFFGKESYLSVSGQLNLECYCMALSKVYTFGPTFRAENSNTTRHLAEFWMIEPEFAFGGLPEDMELAESYLKYLLGWALDKCESDLAFFDKRIQPGLISMLEGVRSSTFVHMTYTDAVKELEKVKERFEFKPYWGCDLQTEHERYLTETLARSPVIVTDYPKEIKAFYMYHNEDGKTVAAMDVLVPKIGEIIGGSKREHRHDVLLSRIKEQGLDESAYWWYLDLRRFGSAPHAGFGLGFERLIRYISGMENIRDVIPFPRAVNQAEF